MGFQYAIFTKNATPLIAATPANPQPMMTMISPSRVLVRDSSHVGGGELAVLDADAADAI